MGNKKYYCKDDKKQTLALNNISTSVTACASVEVIDNVLWNQMKNVLIELHDFGDYDDVTRVPNITNIKNITKNNADKITFTDYFKLLESINSTSEAIQYDLINKYYESLKTAINNYKIPTTRYHCDCGEESCQTCNTCQGCNNCNTCQGCNSCNTCQGHTPSCSSALNSKGVSMGGVTCYCQ